MLMNSQIAKRERISIISVLLTLYIALSPLEFFQFIPGVGSIFRYLNALIVFIILLVFLIQKRKFKFYKSYVFLLVFIFLQFLGVLWAFNTNIHQIMLYSYVKYILILILFTQFNYNKKEIKLLKIVTSIFGGLIAFYFLQKQGMEDYRLTLAVGDTLQDPNISITYFIIPLILTLNLFLSKGNSLFFKMILLFNLSTIVFFILSTGSRGGLLAVTIGVILYVFIDKFNNKKNFLYIIFLIIIFYFLYDYLYSLLPESIQERLMLKNFSAEHSSGRVEIWKYLLKMDFSTTFRAFFGYGLGAVPYALNSQFGLFNASHNLLLQFIGETGLIGMFLMLSFWFNNVKKLILNKYFAMLAINISFIITSLFLDLANLKSFWDMLLLTQVIILSRTYKKAK